MTTTRDFLRRVRIKPYREGAGPEFNLITWDSGRYHRYGQPLIGYRLTMVEGHKRTVLFEGEDFGCSPLHEIDSDRCLAGIMQFLTLKPGDTDSDYFRDYTPAQLEFCETHAEWLEVECMHLFGEE